MIESRFSNCRFYKELINMRKSIALFAVSLLLFTGCKKEEPRLTDAEIALMPQPQTTNLPPATGGFVLSVGGDTIRSDEITDPLMGYFAELARNASYSTFKTQAGPQIESFVVSKISNILLYQQAKKLSDENVEAQIDQAVDTETTKLLADFGGDYAKAEEALKKDGFTGWQDYKEFLKKMILSQSYVTTKMSQEKPVTYDDMLNYYNEVKDKLYVTQARISFQLIDIQPAKLTSIDPNKTREQTAEQLAENLVTSIKEGADFAELAKKHSTGPMAAFGGLWKPVRPDSIAPPFDILANQSQKMEPGQIAGPIKTEEHIFIMKLLEKQAETVQPFENVQPEIKRRIIAERRLQAADQVSREIVQQAAIANVDEFIDFCLRKIYENNRT